MLPVATSTPPLALPPTTYSSSGLVQDIGILSLEFCGKIAELSFEQAAKSRLYIIEVEVVSSLTKIWRP